MDYLEQLLKYSAEAPLLFTQMRFWIFFAVLLLGYSVLYRPNIWRSTYLLVLSLFFYYKSGGYFFSLLILSTVTDYTLGNLIYRSRSGGLRKIYVFCSFLVNLGVLAYFKYAYFFTDVLNSIFQTDIQVVNILAVWTNDLSGSHFDISNIILPVGISFYTFQTISYIMDVYRGKVKPVKNIIDFGFYVSFFPQLVAGPIVRAAEFVPQIYRKYKLTIQEMSHAVFLILSGLIKKMLISDYISINFVDRIFDAPAAYSGFENLMGIYGYSLQIYCDFSGYTDIAIGVGLLLGFRLPLNFNSPYKASNISGFWKRWHISLSSWLRDYLYIPLGGNRKGKTRMHLNILVVMLLGGLWHGASMRFVIWGGLHGLGLVLHKIWQKIIPHSKRPSRLQRFISIIVTFHFVTFLWIFFRAEDMFRANQMLHQIAYNFRLSLVPTMVSSYALIFGIIIAGFILHWLPSRVKEAYRGWFIKMPVYLKILIVVIVVLIIFQAKSSVIQPFIYFQF